MLNLSSTSDIVRVVSGSAGALDVHASWCDLSGSTVTPGRLNTASITTAATTTVVTSPAASTVRNVLGLSISNEHASVTNVVTVEHFDGTTAETLWKGTLAPGERVVFCDTGDIKTYNASGDAKVPATNKVHNFSTANQGAGFATDTYVTGSFVAFPAPPSAGAAYICRIAMSKSAAGTATPIIQVRAGTTGTTSDTSIGTHTFSAGTAVTDTGVLTVILHFRTVGSGTSAVTVSACELVSNPTTGFSSLIHATQATSSGFNSTTAGLGIGVSINGGTSASWTISMVRAYVEGY